jgi:hypothetical protein
LFVRCHYSESLRAGSGLIRYEGAVVESSENFRFAPKASQIDFSPEKGLEFELVVSDDLPLDGTHCVGRVQGGRGLIVHCHECPEADLAAMRSMLDAYPGAPYTD